MDRGQSKERWAAGDLTRAGHGGCVGHRCGRAQCGGGGGGAASAGRRASSSGLICSHVSARRSDESCSPFSRSLQSRTPQQSKASTRPGNQAMRQKRGCAGWGVRTLLALPRAVGRLRGISRPVEIPQALGVHPERLGRLLESDVLFHPVSSGPSTWVTRSRRFQGWSRRAQIASIAPVPSLEFPCALACRFLGAWETRRHAHGYLMATAQR